MDFNVTEYKNCTNMISDSSLQPIFEKLCPLWVISNNNLHNCLARLGKCLPAFTQHITIDCNRPGPLLLFSLLYLHPSFCVGSILTLHYTGLVLHIRTLGTLKLLAFFQQYLPLLTIFSCVLLHHTFLIFFLPLSKLLLPPLLTPPHLTPP